ncbi:MAG: ATP-binding protein [Syntrophales bacterium]|nr:ATP-binding protein [Syntrophales bacterium]MDX9922873.1 ATP-binding protein [Syntrophales bacterium]
MIELKNKVIKKRKLLSAVYRVSRLMNQSANPDTILKAILRESQKLFGLSRAAIILVNKGEAKLEGKYHIGFKSNAEKEAFLKPLCLKTQICRETIVANTGKTIYTRDVANDPNLTEFDKKMERIWKRVSTITVPLKIKKDVLGIIEGDRVDKEMILTENDLRLFALFANQASIILDNARLYRELLEEKNIVKNILENVPNGILAIDDQKRIHSINKRAEEIFNKKRSKVMGKSIDEEIGGRVVEVLNETIDNRKMSHREEIVNHKNDGTTVIYEVNSSILTNNSDQVSGAILTIQDLTEIKKAEAMLMRIQTLASLGQMSASIAHEIRNPLASINLNIQSLCKKVAHDDKMQGTLRNTLEGVERIKLIVKQTLDFSKDVKPAMVRGDIHATLLNSLDLVLPEFNRRQIIITKKLDKNIPEINFDPHQVQNVFINILMNAAESMPNGGRIEISSKISVNDKGKARSILLTIEDNGIGIAQENLKKIFNPFFTTKQNGIGLGLSIVHRILEHHDAVIEIKSRETGGTKIVLRFPLPEVKDCGSL